MVLREKEAYLGVLKSSFLHYAVYVFSKLELPIVLTDIDLHHLALTHHSAKCNHRFLSRATQPHQQNVTLIELKRPCYSSYVGHSI